jgi:hypothetical protein
MHYENGRPVRTASRQVVGRNFPPVAILGFLVYTALNVCCTELQAIDLGAQYF